jgi:hypothetical protein
MLYISNTQAKSHKWLIIKHNLWIVVWGKARVGLSDPTCLAKKGFSGPKRVGLFVPMRVFGGIYWGLLPPSVESFTLEEIRMDKQRDGWALMRQRRDDVVRTIIAGGIGIVSMLLVSFVAQAQSPSVETGEEGVSVPFVMGVGYGYRSMLAGQEEEEIARIHDAVVSWRWGLSKQVWIGGAFQGGGNGELFALRLTPLVLQLEIWRAEVARPFISLGVGLQIERRRDNAFEENQANLGVSGIVTSIGPGVVFPLFDWLELQAEIQVDLVYEDGGGGNLEIEVGGVVSLLVLFDS